MSCMSRHTRPSGTAWVAMMRQEVDFLVEVPNKAHDFVAAASDVDVFMVNRPVRDNYRLQR